MTTEGRPCRGRRLGAAPTSARPSRRALLTGAAVRFGAIGFGAAIASALAEAGRPDPVRSVTAAYTRSGVREALGAESARDLPARSRVMPNLADPGPARRQQEILDGELDDLLRRTSRRLFDLTAHGRSLPPVGPDYWEVGESQVTLGLAGPTLVGMNSLAVLTKADGQLWSRLGGRADTVRRAVDDYRDTFARTFGANGMQRYPSSGGSDSSVAYLPAAGLVPDAAEGVYALEPDILAGVWDRLEQPAGGIKPGHGWISDRSSWTPSTSLMGLGLRAPRAARESRVDPRLALSPPHRCGIPAGEDQRRRSPGLGGPAVMDSGERHHHPRRALRAPRWSRFVKSPRFRVTGGVSRNIGDCVLRTCANYSWTFAPSEVTR
ncbi:hypothetical protein [Brevibacterium limosum]|uniref:hypothetical protein n=1 Tax=Brevibacterium limosum TaxID=2697565 RepID=UPI00141F6AF0|nr:hypothetical protein [Brevibacterium limosum]